MMALLLAVGRQVVCDIYCLVCRYEAEAGVASSNVGPQITWSFAVQCISDARRLCLSPAVLGAAVCTDVEPAGDHQSPVSRRHLQL